MELLPLPIEKEVANSKANNNNGNKIIDQNSESWKNLLTLQQKGWDIVIDSVSVSVCVCACVCFIYAAKELFYVSKTLFLWKIDFVGGRLTFSNIFGHAHQSFFPWVFSSDLLAWLDYKSINITLDFLQSLTLCSTMIQWAHRRLLQPGNRICQASKAGASRRTWTTFQEKQTDLFRCEQWLLNCQSFPVQQDVPGK